MAKITIIILNYNTKELTLRAIQSCLDLSYKDIAVIVVDNNSTDDSVAAFRNLASGDKRVTVISLDVNSGFAAGNNVALKTVETEYAMLLNSDAYFPDGADLETALDMLDQYEDIGVLAPYVELSNGKIDPACHRGIPTPWNAITYFSRLERSTKSIAVLNRIFGGYHQTWKNIQEIHEIDACTGAAMIIRRTAMEEVGLFDEQFFMYGEDLDWCYRFRLDEWKITYYPFLRVIHDKHTSGLKKEIREDHHKEIKRKTKDAFYEAMKLFYKKYDLGPAWIENFVLAGIHILSKTK